MSRGIISFVSGVIFAIGLSVSGMTNPSKVRGFLDILGEWNISLAFVMLGAIVFNFTSFKLILKKQPLYSKEFFLPKNDKIDKRLIGGAVLFGIGWAILGVCPGPGIVNLVTLDTNAILFVVSMTLGMLLFKFLEKNKIVK